MQFSYFLLNIIELRVDLCLFEKLIHLNKYFFFYATFSNGFNVFILNNKLVSVFSDNRGLDKWSYCI